MTGKSKNNKGARVEAAKEIGGPRSTKHATGWIGQASKLPGEDLF